MDDQAESKPPRATQERVTISQEAGGRLDSWISELHTSINGIKLSKSDLVDWLIKSHSETLMPREVSSIKDRFFDDVAFAEWALHTLKEAKSRGDKLSLSDLFSGNAAPPLKPERRRRLSKEQNPETQPQTKEELIAQGSN